LKPRAISIQNFEGLAFGLCDLGLGEPELAELRGPLGCRIERDLRFAPTRTIAAYAAIAYDSPLPLLVAYGEYVRRVRVKTADVFLYTANPRSSGKGRLPATRRISPEGAYSG
jgi:hypothetical protein